MVPGLPRPPNEDDTPRGSIVDSDGFRYGPIPINKVPPSKFFDDAAAILEVEALLREAGEERRAMGRELARRLTMPLPDLLRDGGA